MTKVFTLEPLIAGVPNFPARIFGQEYLEVRGMLM